MPPALVPLGLTPLDERALSPAVQKVAAAAAPPQLKLMAARGMAPLPPQDLATALYQLAHLPNEIDGPIRQAAEKTAKELPEAVLSPALGAALDPRVLDFFARQLVQRSKLLQPLLLNAATADETFAFLAWHASDLQLEQIAQNERRLLRHPAIITALYLNPKTRMSTAQRALELAIRNGVAVEGIPAFEEVKAAIESEGVPEDPALDAAFSAAVAATAARPAAAIEAAGNADEEALAQVAEQADKEADEAEKSRNISQLSTGAKLRLATLGNAFARAVLIRDTNRVIAMAAVRNPGVTEHEAERYAANRSLHEDVIRYIASSRQFTRRYSVKMNLVNNPKCPLQIGMGFLSHLMPKDLRAVSKSKGVPSALAKAAVGLVMKRESR